MVISRRAGIDTAPHPEDTNLKKLLLSLVLAVVFYTVLVLASDARNVGAAIAGMELRWIPLFITLPLVNYYYRFLKWQYFLRRIGLRIPFGRSLQVFLSGFAMTISPGKLGELLKCYLLRDREGIPVARTSPIVIAERITDMLSMILVAVCGVLLVGGVRYLTAAAAGLVLSAAVMYVLLHPGAFRKLTALLCRVPFFGKHRDSLDGFRESCTALLDLRSLLVSIPLGVVSWGIEATVLCAVAASLGYALPVGTAFLAHAAGSIAGAVSMIPGGLGLTEITIDGILAGSLSVSDATAVTLIMRFATLWFAVLLGGITLGLSRRGKESITST